MTVINVIFQNGVFRPKEDIAIPNGTEAEVRIDDIELLRAEVAMQDPQALASWIESVANDAPAGPNDGLTNRDHDTILYGARRTGPTGADE